ncbi:MAG: 2-dehydropantoate 2-reductase [Kiloniellales bacterium]|nr:2-dehydropantoate 2-reductase [Kiloniellales bacterium]
MKVCIYGAGAIGGFLGAALARVPEVEVTLIARGPHLAAIREKGLTLIDRGEVFTVQPAATEDPRELGPQDFVVVALKAYQAWEVADRMAPLLGPETAVVTCQNGVPWWYFYRLGGPHDGVRLASVDPGDRQWRAIGPERAIGCVVYPAAEIKSPGVISNIFGDTFALGEPSGAASARCRRLSAAIESAGLKAPILDRIRDEIWLKLWGNLCFNPISALTRATLDVVATDPGTRAVARAMMAEAYVIATRLGARFRIDIEQRIDRAAGVGAHRTSMLQDLERGRGLEIDALLTVVQEMGRMVEVESPMIDATLALVQQLGCTQGLYPTFPDEAVSPEC